MTAVEGLKMQGLGRFYIKVGVGKSESGSPYHDNLAVQKVWKVNS